VIDGDRIVHEAHYPQPIDEVWHALTDAGSLAAWLMPNDFVAEVGCQFRLDARPMFGIIDGEVIEVDAPLLLRCRWTIEGVPTTVTMTLASDGTGTQLRIEHNDLRGDPRASFDGGWAEKLRHDLVEVLVGARRLDEVRVEGGLHVHSANEMGRQ
jgi:uncharacterized protein YndB with AHSA1/START domain